MNQYKQAAGARHLPSNKFHHDHDINQLIVGGNSKRLHDDPTFTTAEILVLVAEYHELEDDVADDLCLRYVMHVGAERNERTITLRANNTIPQIIITTLEGHKRERTNNDITISCFYPLGYLIEEEVSCNSPYMLEAMPTIGAEIHHRMPWVPLQEPIYLVLDNAGGHWTRGAVDQYTRALRNQFNVIIKQQPACSPGLNALDLVFRIRTSLQSTVE